MKISMIAAIASKNRAIGKNNELVYHISEDLKRFKKITSGHIVIMGRKTFESIGKVLPNRINIVITRNPNFQAENVVVTHSLDEALRLAEFTPYSVTGLANNLPSAEQGNDEVFIIGGGQIYKEAIGKADKLYLTIVEGNPDADTFFPDYSDFKKVLFEEEHESDNLKYKFLDLER